MTLVLSLTETDGCPVVIPVDRVAAIEGIARTDRAGNAVLDADGKPEILGSIVAVDAGATVRINVVQTPQEIFELWYQAGEKGLT